MEDLFGNMVTDSEEEETVTESSINTLDFSSALPTPRSLSSHEHQKHFHGDVSILPTFENIVQ